MNMLSTQYPVKSLLHSFLIVMMSLWSCEIPSSTHSACSPPTAEIAEIESQISEPVIPDNTLNISDFAGIKPDEAGSFDFQPAVQRALDSLEKLGGGVLHFTHPEINRWRKQIVTYQLRGPIHLPDHIELRLDPSIRLFFPFDPEAYAVGKGTLRRYEGTTFYGISPLIYAFNRTDIAITAAEGPGAMPRIDGDGMAWQQWEEEGTQRLEQQGITPAYKMIREVNHQQRPLRERFFNDPRNHHFRPELIHFFMCQNILIDGVQVMNSPFWMIHPVFSQSMIFRNMIFDGQVVNNDGFDPESSRNVLIENIMFNNHDDNVAIKAGRDHEGRNGVDISGTELEGLKNRYIQQNLLGGPTENVIVRNCSFKGHHAVAIGSEMSGGVKNVFAYNNHSPIEIEVGLYLKSSRKRGGTISNIHFFDNHLTKASAAVALLPNYDGDTTSPHIPWFHDIYVSNVTGKILQQAIRINGWPEQPVANVTICNLQIDSVIEGAVSVYNAKNIELRNVSISDTTINQTIADTSGKLPEAFR